MSEPIGYLLGVTSPNGDPQGLAAVCVKCAQSSTLTAYANVAQIPVFEVNIRPYSQHCYLCGSTMLGGPSFDLDLFDGNDRRYGVRSHLCVIPVGGASILEEHATWAQSGDPCTLCGRVVK